MVERLPLRPVSLMVQNLEFRYRNVRARVMVPPDVEEFWETLQHFMSVLRAQPRF